MKSSEKRMPAVSVVIPMYNCVAFVPKLLQMFAEQSFREFEVICVVDGDTDGTQHEVAEFCYSFIHFRVCIYD